MMASLRNGNCPYFFIVAILLVEVFLNSSRFVLLCNGLNIADNKSVTDTSLCKQ